MPTSAFKSCVSRLEDRYDTALIQYWTTPERLRHFKVANLTSDVLTMLHDAPVGSIIMIEGVGILEITMRYYGLSRKELRIQCRIKN